MKHINPLTDIGNKLLCSVHNPARYIGGEYGIYLKQDTDTDITFAIAFPDLYEIAMANQAVKIIYNGLNSFPRIRCERVFAVESDYETLLKQHHIPLYTLETGIPLCDVDIIGFSMGYELGITGVFSILETGNVPILSKERGEQDPIVIAGGCGVTNPMPFAQFFDAVFIGEAENALFELVEQLRKLKIRGAGRAELLSHIEKHPSVWIKNKPHTERAVWNMFGQVKSVPSYLPQPTIRPVQDHGVIEIMRGCPNGCRFCHAGIYYRPQRVKNTELIEKEVAELIAQGGYREISLMSLSSGDYPGIDILLNNLSKAYKNRYISFQLPSLKVNSFNLPLIEQISQVRKSGLTFAVETPEEAWQLALNKEVYSSKLKEIILQAKKQGWHTAKFYFMIGLPFEYTKSYAQQQKTEEEAIVDFLLQLQQETRIQCHVNIGTFVPKPHTPYQWCRQLSIEDSCRKIAYIREHLPKKLFKVTNHNIYASFLEGLISRGDERTGNILLAAYKKGCRLDAWDDKLKENIPLWQQTIEEASWDVYGTVFRQKQFDEVLPWDNISLGPRKLFYKTEWDKSCNEELTSKCSEKCMHNCGVCNNKLKVFNKNDLMQLKPDKTSAMTSKNTLYTSAKQNIKILWRVIFSFSKKNGSEYIPHLSLQELFYRAMVRSALPVVYTAGFNPIPRIEFASTLAIGLISHEEIVSCLLYENCTEDSFIQKMNDGLPRNLFIEKAFIFPVTNKRKRESLAVSYWGSEYACCFNSQETVALFNNFLIENTRVSVPLLKMNTDVIDTECINYRYVMDTNAMQFIVPFIYEKKLRTFFSQYLELNYEKQNEIFLYKIHTYASPVIHGNGHDKYSCKSNQPISYYDLYKIIAAINKDIIDAEKDFS